MTSQAKDQEPPSSLPEGEKPSGTRMHNWLNAEAEVRRIGDLARQLLEVDGQLTRQMAEGKDADVRRTEHLARQLVEIQERLSRQMAESKVAERRLVAEHAVSRFLAVSDTLSDAAPKIIQAICESLDWDVGTVWELDRKASVLRCAEVWHAPKVKVPAFEHVCRESTFSQDTELPGWVWADKALAWFPDLTTEANIHRWLIAAEEGLHGAIGFPIRNEIEFFGVIEFFSREIRQPDEKLIEMMTSIGSQISQFIDRRKAKEELVKQEVDRHTARRIQQGLLPRAMPRFAGYDISGRSSTADDVGGDWFDYIPLVVEGQECLDVLVADVSGHGIASALIAGQTCAYLRAFALTCSDVGTILNLTNHRLAADLITGYFVTLLLVQLDPRTRSLRYASAGHNPGYVLDPQGRTKAVLGSTGIPLGIDSSCAFPTGPSVTLEPGELVFLYTDGIVEAGSKTGKPFRLERALDVVRAHQQETPDEILEALFDAVGGSGHHRDDDQTAVIIKVEGVA
jgi:serine phosphatase RsbU (regulator of sigma subunit)